MKIYLFTNSNIVSFSLPDVVSGSFSFDENEEEENKILNIEAVGDTWYLYATDEVWVQENNKVIDKTPLKNNTFYTLVRAGVEYLAYVSSTESNVTQTFSFDKSIDLMIGAIKECNLQYNCSLLKDEIVKINYLGEYLTIYKTAGVNVYINNTIMSEPQRPIKSGDTINIYGFKITVLPGVLILCYSENSLTINRSTNLSLMRIDLLDKPEDIVVKDIDLYDKSNFFSKSPRIRRTIEKKKIKLSNPPQLPGDGSSILLSTIPSLLFSVSSIAMLVSLFKRINEGTTTLEQSWMTLLSSGAMLITSLVWPLISRLIQKIKNNISKKNITAKYGEYLKQKEAEIIEELNLEKEILLENLVTVNQCVEMIKTQKFPFWNKRSDQKDFLSVRIGIGNVPLQLEIDNPEQGFTLDEGFLEKQVNDLRGKYKFISDMPISYSLYDNRITAVMGNKNKCTQFVNNMILQLISFYSYEDLRLVVFTNEVREEQWDYLKYLNHNFNDDMSFRFFSTNSDTAKTVIDALSNILGNRLEAKEKSQVFTPYYLIIVDDYDKVKRYEFIRKLTELEANVGFSVIFVENRLSKLPSKCNNFITIGDNTSGVLTNAYEQQEQMSFVDEIEYNINMMEIAKVVSNIPIEFEKNVQNQLPESISFLELEKVGKVEQLNILNRWQRNDSTASLKAEVGVNGQGDVLYLDLHEKYHGPHGLIAGMTGSGKSEFIISYILSMAINYSPDDVSFILIDYKGGGLAYAFKNEITKKVLPHIAGVITNLDKAEMDRTLVSIESELQRRQKMFNSVRDLLGESTMDIYKYQRLFKEGKIQEPISHLFIICDEFAELKTNQPDFMDSLISAARIGRSLGVHLILATQKPSGVVNDQIWSNTKFRVCLKVQDESDSREMLKKPDAASLKEAGRFYLQVGFDEYYVLGQSGWSGAKYYPAEKVVKTVDKNVDIINDCGEIVKSMQYSTEKKVQAKTDQLTAIMDELISVAEKVNKSARQLWLENIPPTILLKDIETKYNYQTAPFKVESIVGEYDAPEIQEQGIVKYNYLNDGNLIIYGDDGSENEALLKTMIFSAVSHHTPQEISYYVIDYGSESLRVFDNLPHFGGGVYAGETEKLTNLLKLITAESQKRKKLFSKYAGKYSNYINDPNMIKLPIMTVILNNFDSIYENNQDLYEILPSLTRDSERYGIVFWITGSGTNSVNHKVTPNFSTIYTFKLKSSSDYGYLFGVRTNKTPRDTFGRGLLNNNGVHEFQTASIVADSNELNNYLMEFANNYKGNDNYRAISIPSLPNQVTFNHIRNYIGNINKVPIGIAKNSLDICLYDLLANQGIIIAANRLEYTTRTIESLVQLLGLIANNLLIVIDATKTLSIDRGVVKFAFSEKLDEVLAGITSKLKELKDTNSRDTVTILVYGIEKLFKSLDNEDGFKEFMDAIKGYDKACIIIVDGINKIKVWAYEAWFTMLFSVNDGIWIGKGMGDQSLFRVNSIDKTLSANYPNDMGFVINEGYPTLVKLIDFNKKTGGQDEQ